MSRPQEMTTGEAARALGLTPEAVRLRCEKGRIPGAYQLDPGTPWRIPRAWVKGKQAKAHVVRRSKAPAD